MKKIPSNIAFAQRCARLPGAAAMCVLAMLSAAPLSAQPVPDGDDPLLAIIHSAAPEPMTDALPDIRRANGVEYLSGGIGVDESQAIKAEAIRWPLLITMAQRSQARSEWVADVELEIRDADQALVLAFRSDGPLALIRLAPGRYTIDARYDGIELQRTVTIGAGGSQKLMLLWKADPR